MQFELHVCTAVYTSGRFNAACHAVLGLRLMRSAPADIETTGSAKSGNVVFMRGQFTVMRECISSTVRCQINNHAPKMAAQFLTSSPRLLQVMPTRILAL